MAFRFSGTGTGSAASQMPVFDTGALFGDDGFSSAMTEDAFADNERGLKLGVAAAGAQNKIAMAKDSAAAWKARVDAENAKRNAFNPLKLLGSVAGFFL